MSKYKNRKGGDTITKYLYALDLSISETGVVIFDIDTFEPIRITSIATNPKHTHGERLNVQREFIKDLMEKYPPHEVAIERGFSHRNLTTQVLYKVHGVYNELLHNYEQFYYAPTTVKKDVTGNGKSKKEALMQEINKRYPDIKFKNTDQSDAFSVGISHFIKEYKMEWN